VDPISTGAAVSPAAELRVRVRVREFHLAAAARMVVRTAPAFAAVMPSGQMWRLPASSPAAVLQAQILPPRMAVSAGRSFSAARSGRASAALPADRKVCRCRLYGKGSLVETTRARFARRPPR
jgi:hypothetical protein